MDSEVRTRGCVVRGARCVGCDCVMESEVRTGGAVCHIFQQFSDFHEKNNLCDSPHQATLSR